MAQIVFKTPEARQAVLEVCRFAKTLPKAERKTLGRCIARFKQNWRRDDRVLQCALYGGTWLPQHSLDWAILDQGTTVYNGGIVYFPGDGWSIHS